MRPYERWTESYLDGKLFESDYVLFEHRLATLELLAKLETLFEPLSQLKNQSTSAEYGVEYYEFYFRVPRGSFEESEYGEYDDLSEKEEREYRKIFDRSYRKKWYWHTLTFSRNHYRGDVFYGILIGRRTLLSVSDGKGDDAKRDFKTIAECEWIKPLGGLLQALMKSIQEGTYESFVSKNLDYEMRSGEILYKDYWKLYPKEGKAHYRRYEGVDIGLFRSYWKSGVMLEKNTTHFKRLSANQYCRYFCIASSALGLSPSKEKTHQQNYKWASDGRTLGLDLIDGESYEEFDRWYASQRPGFDHAFEIRYWENGTRIDLRIEKDRDGYFLYLTCEPANEAGIKVYLALAKEGVFTHIFEPKDYLSYFNGTNLRSVDSEENYYGHPFPASKKKSVHRGGEVGPARTGSIEEGLAKRLGGLFMSRDVYFRRVWKPDPPLNNQINEGEVGYNTPYRAFRLEEAEEWMKDVSQVVRIKRSHSDIFEACKKRFGKTANHARWLFHPDGYEFCDENGVPFGRLYRSDLEEFIHYTEEEEYVFQYEDVVEPMTDYAVQLEGVQSAQALLDEALRIISLDANEHDGLYHTEAIYALVKCHNLALKGEKIWIRFN